MLTRAACCAFLFAAPALALPPTFQVSFDPSTRPDPATGRLIIYLIKDGSKVVPNSSPSDGPFWEDPQPLFGINVTNLAPGTPATVDNKATTFPPAPFEVPPSDLAPGTYRAQAVLDLHYDDSDWHREPGNLFSDTLTFTVTKDGVPAPIALKLTNTVKAKPLPDTPGVELFELRSKLLSDFHHRDITLRAGVIFPTAHDPARSYAAIYEVPGFGADHTTAWQPFHPYRTRLPANSGWTDLRTSAFWIILNPESGNGHTLFADSANNGPCGQALVEELIPALEAKYHLIAKPEARLLRGHSSGGWSTLWLALTYPETFGACWSTSPDPVDFHRLQLVDIYGQTNMYALPTLREASSDPKLDRFNEDKAFTLPALTPDAGPEIASTRSAGRATMTIRTENAGEEVLGPDNTSGQQWDSWLAVWGPRNANGHPAALYDPITGKLDHTIADQLKKYDIAERLRADPAHLGPIFRERIRLAVGDQDTFFLNEAVTLLKAQLDNLPPTGDTHNPQATNNPQNAHGYIKILPGLDHGTIFQSPDLKAIPQEMADHLKRAGLLQRDH